MGDGTTVEDKLRWLSNRVAELDQDIQGHHARWHADAKQLAAQGDELIRLRLENHRLLELVRKADLVHIRLRAGLKEALDELDQHAVDYDHVTPAAKLGELRKLVSP